LGRSSVGVGDGAVAERRNSEMMLEGRCRYATTTTTTTTTTRSIRGERGAFLLWPDRNYARKIEDPIELAKHNYVL
jgi:hypothetical protein